jgi:hypothetical protein
MSLFDGRGMGGPMPTNLAEMGRGVGQSISRGLLDPYMESKGYVSQENQILEIMQGADLTDANSVSDTFNKIMMISPEAAAEFQKQVMPMLEANQTASAALVTESSNLGKYYADAERILSAGDPNFDITTPDGLAKAKEFVNRFKKSETAFSTSVGGEYGKTVIKSFNDAEQAVSSLFTIETGLDLLDQGINTGAFAKTENAARAILNKVGLTKDDSVGATQAYTATLGNLVGQIIKQFGAGTGLSDADREYALGIAGGNINFDEYALRKILDIQKRVQIAIINKHNTKASALPEDFAQKSGMGDTSFMVAIPQLKDRPTLHPSGATRGKDKDNNDVVVWEYPDGTYHNEDGTPYKKTGE